MKVLMRILLWQGMVVRAGKATKEETRRVQGETLEIVSFVCRAKFVEVLGEERTMQ